MTIEDTINGAVEYLKSLQDQTEISTSEALAATCGFEYYPDGEFLVGDIPVGFNGILGIDMKIRKAAQKARLVIDESLYADMATGLTFHVPFLVSKRKRK